MAEVKRRELMWDEYGEPAVLENEKGGLVLYSDHLREVTRLQRANLKLFVRCLNQASKSYFDDYHIQKMTNLGSNERLVRRSVRLARLAKYIEAKYLKGEK